jgi:hypothetical protein
MRKRTARMAWLVAGGVALGALAIAATSYVMRLDQESLEQQRGVIGGSTRMAVASPRRWRPPLDLSTIASTAMIEEVGEARAKPRRPDRRSL